MRKITTIALTMIIGLSMTLAPSMAAEELDVTQTDETVSAEEAVPAEDDVAAEEVAAAEMPDITADNAFEGLEGLNISDVENDPELCALLEDPTFFRYYEVDESGILCKKQFDLDEVEQFIADADANAEGIDDVDNIQPCDITAMGGGVTGLGKGQTPAKYASYNRYHCIDISWWQGSISAANWKKVRAAGVTHAIIRCGYSSLSNGAHNMDSTFANNVNGAYNAGIKVGVYYYSTAVSAAEATSEAQYVKTLLTNYRSKITLPVAFDYETGGRLTSKVMKNVGTASCTAFCDTIKAAGYEPMVYANYNTLTKFISYATLQSKYKIWLANYTTNGVATTYPGDYWMWQYSSSGIVNGISKRVDINYIFESKTAASTAASTASTASTTAVSTIPAGCHAAVTTCKMNYRKGPSKKKKIVGSYSKGTTVYIKSFHGNWAKLSNGYYMNRSHLKYKAKTRTAVNYRTGPGTKYKKKGTYKKGVFVTIVQVKNGWARMSNGRWLAVKYTGIQ
ncbi:MAG: glycoside hydrolase family 25 protein [Clostridia bacterium]|nr:glycoside hydrolase family 25 protein [Clostridia bacterium]